MACTSFSSCVSDPLVDNALPAATSFADLSSTAIFSINLTLYIFYTLLIVAVVYSVFKGITSIIGADSADSYEKFRGAITNAVFAAIGLVLLMSTRFIFVVVLRLVGIPDPENIFIDLPF